MRLAGLLTERTGVTCALTNLAADGAKVGVVLARQLPLVAGVRPDLVSLTVGMNDIRAPAFTCEAFAAALDELLDGLAATGATVLTVTLPDIASILPLEEGLVEIARDRMRQASAVIRDLTAARGWLCVDAWARPDVADPALFSQDRLHPNAAGHQLMAASAADLLLAGQVPGGGADGE